MGNEIHAQIFGRRRHGDREEVKMKLYHQDGSEFVPGSTVTGRLFHGDGSPTKLGPLTPLASDDFSVDHRNDPDWWEIEPRSDGNSYSSVSGEKFTAGLGFGNMMFMLPPPGVQGRVSMPLRLTDPSASVRLDLCAEKTLASQGIGAILLPNSVQYISHILDYVADQQTYTFPTPLTLNHLYTLSVEVDAECRGVIRVYDGPVSGSPLYKLDFDNSYYKNYYYATPGRPVFSGSNFTADEFLYEAPAPPAPLGQDDDFYIDDLTGDIYGPKEADTWPPVLNKAGLSTRMVDVVATIDMTPTYPEYVIDCAGKTAVHARRLLIQSGSGNKEVAIKLDNIALGVPYQITVENNSTFAHYISLRVGPNWTDPMAIGGKVKRAMLLLAPREICSIMSLYTGANDRPLAVTTQQPRSPRRDVTANYACTEFDINGLIVVNSSNPVTITIRDQNLGEWWTGEEIEVYQAGTGVVTIASPSGTTLLRAGGLSGSFAMPGGRYSTVKLRSMEFQKWALV